MRSLSFMLITGLALVVFGSGDAAADDDDDADVFFRWQVGTLVVLGLLYHTRRDTSKSDRLNKILKIGLYGMAFLSFLIGLVAGLISGNTWVWWMSYAILFALTGSHLGHIPLDINKKRPKTLMASRNWKFGSQPTSADSRKTLMFEPENELTKIECPGCSAKMDIPKLGAMQKVTCDECGLSGEIEI